MKPLIYFLLIPLLLISCGKKVTVKGRAYNALTGEGISGIDVTIGRENKSLLITGDGDGGKIIATRTTNEIGFYNFNERIRKNRKYSLSFNVDEEKHFKLHSSSVTINQENKTIDFPLIPVGYMKQKVENESCFDENDLLDIFKSHEIIENYYGSNTMTWEGCVNWEFKGSVDGSPQGYVFAPMGWHYANGYVIKNGVQTEIKDSIYVGEQEFVTWHIKY